MQPSAPRCCITRFLVLTLFLCSFRFPWVSTAYSQEANPVTPAQSSTTGGQQSSAAAPEIVSQGPSSTYKLNVNLVQVRVVVRDSQGKPVANLKKEDFLLFDNRKPQVISTFSVDTPAAHATAAKNDSATPPNVADSVSAANPVQLPQRFVALYFDDVHISESDLQVARQAAMKLLGAMTASDRLAIFTSSGQPEQEFTADPSKLSATLQQLAPHPLGPSSASADCPPMTYYEAYAIDELHDDTAFQIASQDFVSCSGQAPNITRIRSAVMRARQIGDSESHVALGNLDAIIRRMSVLPGERVIVLVSPGFFMTPMMQEMSDLIDRALKVNVVVNTLDARGLYTSGVFSAAQSPNATVGVPRRTQFVETEESLQGDLLSAIADGTGGRYFHNRNDLDQGLLQLGAQPEVSYVLGFSPRDLKLDGKYHTLKVSLASKTGWTLQARRGYFAPRSSDNPEQAAYAEIDQALTSQDELRELPLECQTQVFKTANQARLSVVARIDPKSLKFRHVDDRNHDDLKVVMALFDNNGNFVSAMERGIKLQLKDATLTALNKTGIRVKLDFDTPPGNFFVRVVVRDSEGAQLGATSQAVTIPD
jgi:VWFA-related protein